MTVDTNEEQITEGDEMTKPNPVIDTAADAVANGARPSHLRVLLVVLVIVVAAAIAIVAYLGAFNGFLQKEQQQPQGPTQEELDAQKHAEIVADTWSSRGLESTTEQMSAYIAELDASLSDPTIPEKTKKLLLLRKALALSAIRGEASETATAEAFAILRDLYTMEPADDEERTYKNAAIPLSLQILKSNNYAEKLGELIPGGYDTTYHAYLAAGHPGKEAVILAFKDFAHAAPDEAFKGDRSLVTERAYITALYLYAFGGNDEEADTVYLNQLRDDVSRYDDLEAMLLRGSLKGDVRPAVAHAFAFDIAQTYGMDTVPKDTHDAIDFAYEQAFINADLTSNLDEMTRNIVKIENALNYLDSLHRRYSASELDASKVNRAIDMLVASVSYNEVTQSVFSGYLMGGKSDVGSWIPMRANFYDVAEKYPVLKELVANYSSTVAE